LPSDALSDRYARDGLSATERSELQLHAQVLASRADPPPRRRRAGGLQ